MNQEDKVGWFERFWDGMTAEINLSRIYFNLILVTYFLVGVVAFVVSAYIEAQVFIKVTNENWFSWIIAGVFECAKAVTILVHRSLSYKFNVKIPAFIELVTHSLKILLIFISLICSLAFISFYLDRPYLEQVKQHDLLVIQQEYEQQYKNMLSEYQLKLSLLDKEYNTEFERLKSYYEPKIDDLEKIKRAEMKNVVGGQWKGSRYNEFDIQQKDLQREYQNKIEQLRQINASSMIRKARERERLENFLTLTFCVETGSSLKLRVLNG